MTILFNIPEASASDWMMELKPYQRKIILTLLTSENQDAEKAAEKWLTETGSQNITPFGGANNPKPFWENFKNEFNRFLCDETAYSEIKHKINSENAVLKSVFVYYAAVGIGNTIGLTATLLAPAIVLMLIAVGNVGMSAYCKTYYTENFNLVAPENKEKNKD